MNAKLLVPTLFTGVLLSACASLGSSPPADLWGDPAPVAAATRTIVLAPNTRYVNVTGGEIVKFVVDDKAFAWNFDGAQYVAPFDLTMVAPPGVLDHKVVAYVAPNPLYLGADGHDGHGGHGGGHGGK